MDVKDRPFRMAISHYHVAHSTAFWVAQELTYFQEEGLGRYEFFWEGLTPALLERESLARAMWERGIHVILDARPRAAFRAARPEDQLCIIGCWRNQVAWNAVGAASIRSLADLPGKRVGVRDIGGIDYALWTAQLRRAGVDPDSIRWVPGLHEIGHTPGALRRGEIDAALVPIGEDQEMVKEGFTLLFESRYLYPHGRPDRVMMAPASVLEERPEELRAFLRAIIRAYWFLRDRRNYEYLAGLDRRIRQMCGNEEERGMYAPSGTPYQIALREGGGEWQPFPMDGAPSVEGLQAMLEEEQEAGAAPKGFNLEEVLRLDFVREAYSELARRPQLAPELERMKRVVAEYGY